MSEHKKMNPNSCIVTDHTVLNAANLLQGRRLRPDNFADLCNLIEMAILHERVLLTHASLAGSALERLSDTVLSTIPKEYHGNDVAQEAFLAVEDAFDQMASIEDFGPDFTRSRTDEDERTFARSMLHAAMMVLLNQYKGAEIKPEAQHVFEQIKHLWNRYGNYTRAVFQAARQLHIQAYGSSIETATAIECSVSSVPRLLHDRLQEVHKNKISDFLVRVGYERSDIPPFALIVLSRSKTREDIVPQILRAREEFRSFRETCTQYAMNLRDAVWSGNGEAVIEINKGFDRAFESLSRKIGPHDRDSRLLFRVWNVVKGISPLGMMKNLFDMLLLDQVERESLRAVNGLLDVWRKLAAESPYEPVLHSRLFPREFDQQEFNTFGEFLGHISACIPVGAKSQ